MTEPEETEPTPLPGVWCDECQIQHASKEMAKSFHAVASEVEAQGG